MSWVESSSRGSTQNTTVWMGGFGHMLKDKQRHAKLTNRQLATKAKLSPSTIARYRNGQLPTVKKFLSLMRALDMPVESFDFVSKQRGNK